MTKPTQKPLSEAIQRWREMSAGEIERFVDAELRHNPKKGLDPYNYLLHWLKIGRCFGFATRDYSWGEFEKLFSIIIRRMVIAERALAQREALLEKARKYVMPGESDSYESVWVMFKEQEALIAELGEVIDEALQKLKDREK